MDDPTTSITVPSSDPKAASCPKDPKDPKAPKASKGPTLSKNGKRIGRPPKRDLTREGSGQPGARKGDKAILEEYRHRMLASPKSRAVLQKVLDTALDDGHPHQGACMKLVMDRLVPQGAVANLAGQEQNRGRIVIEVRELGAVREAQDIEDAEYENVEE